MSSFYRANLYGGHDEEPMDNPDEYDMSGFLSGDAGNYRPPMAEEAAKPNAKATVLAIKVEGGLIPK